MKPDRSTRATHLIIASLLLIVFLAQVLLASPANSAAFDEEYHLGAGYAYLRTGDPRLSTEHPPLINVWNALPLTFLNPNLPLDNPAWQNAATDDFSDAFLWQANYDHAIPIVLLGRIPIALLGVLLGSVIFRWARDLFGVNAGLLALVLFAFDPNLIAQSRLSTTDLGLALMMTIAMWRMWAWLEKPVWLNLILTGIFAGAAVTTKFTGILLAPLFLIAALIYPTVAGTSPLKVIARRMLSLILAGLIALLMIWIVYGFEIKDGLPAATYWRGLIKVFAEYSQGYPTYLLGQISRTGWWYYFPITFLLKTPLPTLILFAIGLITIFTHRVARHTSAAWAPPFVLMAFALASPLAIGYRHILPILPFVIITGGQAMNIRLPAQLIPPRWSRLLRGAGGAILVGWLIAGTVAIYPYHLSYFNELAGGPLNANRILVDSNLDWGQDLPALKRTMDERGLRCVNLSFFGTALPAVYGVRYAALPGFLHFLYGADVNSFNPYTPEPGWYAISETSRRLGTVWGNNDLYAYFRDRAPVARAGYSIGLYEVNYPPEMPVTRAVVVSAPAYQVLPRTLGVTPNTRVNVKWIDNPDAFVFVNGPARYLAGNPLPFDRVLRREFRAAGKDDGGALIVDARPIVQSHLAGWQAHQPYLPDGTQTEWPIRFNDKLDLIGYRIDPVEITAGHELDLTTYWQVSGNLDECDPVTMFAHVTSDQAGIVGQYDGWGIAPRGLETGDVIIQHARIPIKPDTATGHYALQVGIYSTDTLQRWTARAPSGQETDRVILSPVVIASP